MSSRVCLCVSLFVVLGAAQSRLNGQPDPGPSKRAIRYYPIDLDQIYLRSAPVAITKRIQEAQRKYEGKQVEATGILKKFFESKDRYRYVLEIPIEYNRGEELPPIKRTSYVEVEFSKDTKDLRQGKPPSKTYPGRVLTVVGIGAIERNRYEPPSNTNKILLLTQASLVSEQEKVPEPVRAELPKEPKAPVRAPLPTPVDPEEKVIVYDPKDQAKGEAAVRAFIEKYDGKVVQVTGGRLDGVSANLNRMIVYYKSGRMNDNRQLTVFMQDKSLFRPIPRMKSVTIVGRCKAIPSITDSSTVHVSIWHAVVKDIQKN